MHAARLDIQEQRGQRSTRVCVAGEVDFATADGLRSRLAALHAERTDVELDLSQVEFMDTSGVRVLVDEIAEARRNGWRLELAPEVPHQVRRMFELLQLDKSLLERTA